MECGPICGWLLWKRGTNVLHSGNRSRHTHCCTRASARGGFGRWAGMGETTVLVATGQGSPVVPFIQLPVLPERICDRVVPPAPVRVERSQPFPKGGSQLSVGVAREDEDRLEQGLPCGFGLAARGLEVGPTGGSKSVGLALAVPRFRKDVGSCCVAHVRQVGEAHEEPDFVEELAAGWLDLIVHQDFIDG